MKFTKPRATFEETLEFCNAVRKAGGGNPLDALMPAVPMDASQCLIAKNLNFNCGVAQTTYRDHHRWVMAVSSLELRNRLASELGLTKINLADEALEDWGQEQDQEEEEYGTQYGTLYGVILPDEIGQVAKDFDTWHSVLNVYRTGYHSKGEFECLKDFAPYVEESIRETKAHGVFNSKGELIL